MAKLIDTFEAASAKGKKVTINEWQPVVRMDGRVPDVDVGGFNVLRIRGVANHHIQI